MHYMRNGRSAHPVAMAHVLCSYDVLRPYYLHCGHGQSTCMLATVQFFRLSTGNMSIIHVLWLTGTYTFDTYTFTFDMAVVHVLLP